MLLQGALWGAISSLIVVSFLAVGAQLNIAAGNLKYPTLPFRVDGCAAPNPNMTFLLHHSPVNNQTYYIHGEDSDNSAVPWYFRIGFMYYSLIGTIITMVVGFIVSSYTAGDEKPCDLKLLTPVCRRFYKQNTSRTPEKDQVINATAEELLELKKIIDKC